MGVPARLVLLVALAMAGCLSAPPEQTEKDDGGDPSCSPIVIESFEDGSLDDAVWDTDMTGTGSVVLGDGHIVLTSPPDEAGSYAELDLRAPAPLANTVLVATFSAETSGGGSVYFDLSVTEDDQLSFYVQSGLLHAEYEIGGDDEELCAPCPEYAGERITVRVTSTEAQATFDWGAADGETVELFATSPALLAGPAILQIETFSTIADSATVTLEELSWSECE